MNAKRRESLLASSHKACNHKFFSARGTGVASSLLPLSALANWIDHWILLSLRPGDYLYKIGLCKMCNGIHIVMYQPIYHCKQQARMMDSVVRSCKQVVIQKNDSRSDVNFYSPLFFMDNFHALDRKKKHICL